MRKNIVWHHRFLLIVLTVMGESRIMIDSAEEVLLRQLQQWKHRLFPEASIIDIFFLLMIPFWYSSTKCETSMSNKCLKRNGRELNENSRRDEIWMNSRVRIKEFSFIIILRLAEIFFWANSGTLAFFMSLQCVLWCTNFLQNTPNKQHKCSRQRCGTSVCHFIIY